MFAKDDVDFIAGRLVGTIVKHKEEPIYVDSVAKDATGEVTVGFLYLVNPKKRHTTNIDNLDLRPVSLGYVNFDKMDSLWLCRVPRRAWKQGLCNENIVSSRNVNLTENLKNIRDTILGDYPTIANASASGIKKAFSRDFAVCKDKISYKYIDDVGFYRDGKVSLKDQFIYLREYLEEVS